MTNFGEALAGARAALAAAGVPTAALDARLLMADAAGLDSAALIARGREAVPALAERVFDAHLKRRLKGEPVARILREKEFWGLAFEVDASTLTPRPDTEALVECVLAKVRRTFPTGVSICDLGTGSGAIVVALLKELPEVRAVATDISAAALAVARQNAERHGVAERLCLEQVDFGDGPEGPFDVVVSNPPYVRTAEIDALEREVRDFDPHTALDGGPDGLDAYRTILGRAGSLLVEGGLLALEIGHDQDEAVATLCSDAGLVDISVQRDLAGRARVVMATRPGLGGEGAPGKKALGKVVGSG
jgi:release factor glutamine methyltransferase